MRSTHQLGNDFYEVYSDRLATAGILAQATGTHVMDAIQEEIYTICDEIQEAADTSAFMYDIVEEQLDGIRAHSYRIAELALSTIED